MSRRANRLSRRQRGTFLPRFADGLSMTQIQAEPIMLATLFPRAARALLSVFLTFSIAAPVSLLVAEPASAATRHHKAETGKATSAKTRAAKAGASKSSAKATAAQPAKRKHRIARHARKAAVAAAATAAMATPVALSAGEVAAQERRRTPAHVENPIHLPLDIASRAALVTNAKTGEVLYGKNFNQTMPIASITKLMTAMIVLDAGLDLNDPITITEEDVDHYRHTHSRLSVGTTLTRGDVMLIALMASENRAASALARTYPGGFPAAIAAMNRKARSLGMNNTRFLDSTGLHGENASTPGDLVKMVQAANRYADIRAFSTTPEYSVMSRGRLLQYKNTNGLVKKPDWNIEVSKTGFINEAGRCLVMMARVSDTPVVIVLMDSDGKYTRIGDANRVKRWLEVALRS